MKTIHETITEIVNAASADDYRQAVKLLLEFSNQPSVESKNTSPNKNTLEALGHAWNLYLEANDHQTTAMDADDLNHFRKAIQDAQRIVATRELQLVKPEFFK